MQDLVASPSFPGSTPPSKISQGFFDPANTGSQFFSSQPKLVLGSSTGSSRQGGELRQPKYVVKSAPEKSPPFTFMDAPQSPDDAALLRSMEALPPTLFAEPATSSGQVGGSTPDSSFRNVWKCQKCGKVKNLFGPHLAGKTSVRSDCWPCGLKRVFVLTQASSVPPYIQRMASGAGPAGSTGGSTMTSPATACSFAQFMASEGLVAPASELLHAGKTDSFPISEALLSKFSLELLRHFRGRLRNYVPLRSAWHQNVLYVIAEEPPIAKNPPPNELIYEAMGRYAALFLSIEQKLTSTRLQYMRRLFCPSEFSFAAACCYALTFHEEEGGRWGCQVFGPSGDPTIPRSTFGAVVSGCSYATPTLISEQQRLRGAQLLYKRVNWLCPSAHVAGVAIQELEEQRHPEHVLSAEGVDVVLLSGTMSIEELPQAATLALPTNPF